MPALPAAASTTRSPNSRVPSAESARSQSARRLACGSMPTQMADAASTVSRRRPNALLTRRTRLGEVGRAVLRVVLEGAHVHLLPLHFERGHGGAQLRDGCEEGLVGR